LKCVDVAVEKTVIHVPDYGVVKSSELCGLGICGIVVWKTVEVAIVCPVDGELGVN
jgi:hypothetical protein